MVEIDDIKDGRSFDAWLEQEDLPREAVVAMAHRAAIRVLPIAWKYFAFDDRAKQRDLTALPIMRCGLVSSVTARGVTKETNNAARAAAAAVRAAYTAASADAAAASADAISAASSAARAAYGAASAARIAASAAASASASADAVAFWAALRADCRQTEDVPALLSRPIWGEAPNPLNDEWHAVDSGFAPSGPDGVGGETTRESIYAWEDKHPYVFWLDWYHRALDGTETRWPLLRQIALLDEDETGESYWTNPEKLAAKIVELEEQYKAGLGQENGPTDAALGEIIEATPNAERIAYDADIEAIRAIPESDLPDDYLSDTQDRLRDAAEDFGDLENPGNQYSALSPDVAKLRRSLERYADRPLRLHDVSAELWVRLDIRIANGECPEAEKDAIVASYRNALNGAMTDIQAHDARVREALKARIAHGIDKVADGDQALLAEGVEDAAKITDDVLRAELREDIVTIADPFATPEAMRNALWRLSSRLPRILFVYRHEMATIVTLGGGLRGAVAWLIAILIGAGT